MNGIGDEGAKKISEALKTNTVLITLNLDGGIMLEMREIVLRKRRMMMFECTDNGIGSEGMTEITEAMMINTTLTGLDMNHHDDR